MKNIFPQEAFDLISKGNKICFNKDFVKDRIKQSFPLRGADCFLANIDGVDLVVLDEDDKIIRECSSLDLGLTNKINIAFYDNSIESIVIETDSKEELDKFLEELKKKDEAVRTGDFKQDLDNSFMFGMAKHLSMKLFKEQ